VIVSTDRGLCGGLNTNLFRKLLGEIREWQDKGVEVDMVCIGQKATAFFRRSRSTCSARSPTWARSRKVDQLIGVIKVMLDAYTDGRIDRPVFLVYNDFVNTMTQRATTDQLLPLPPSTSCSPTHDWDYLYEPDAATVLITC
jgi:F-type H+-transporting ATPase subunit gamma